MNYINSIRSTIKLKELSSETKKASVEMNNIISEVSNLWSGEASGVFCEKFEILEKKINNIAKDISLLADILSNEVRKVK